MYSHVHRNHHVLEQFGKLHVIAVCFNPMRYQSRYRLFREFVTRAAEQGAVVHVAEASFGERPHETTDRGQTQHWTFRTSSEVWHKESVINAAVARLPEDWKYVAWVDADVAFTSPHWVQETIQQLQHFSIVQMFHTAIDLDPSNLPIKQFMGFPASALEHPEEPNPNDGYYHGRKGNIAYWHPGFAWACRRDAWDTMGGLLDINIVGGADHQMAHGLYGRIRKAIPFQSTPGYKRAVLAWETHAKRLQANVGFVPGTLLHYWHGKKAKRGYFNRWQILAKNKFDPRLDLKRDWQGLYQLAGNKPQLRDDLRKYFRSRNEDSLDV